MDVSDSLLSSQSSQLEHLAASNNELSSSNNTQSQSDAPGGGATSSSAGHDPVEAAASTIESSHLQSSNSDEVAVSSNIEVHSSEQSQRDNLELRESQPGTSKEVVMPVAVPGKLASQMNY